MKTLNFKIRADKADREYDKTLRDIDERLALIVFKMQREAEKEQHIATRELKPRYIRISIRVSLHT